MFYLIFKFFGPEMIYATGIYSLGLVPCSSHDNLLLS